MKKIILSAWITLGCLLLAVAFSVQPALAAEKEALMPMALDGTQWAIEVTSVNKKGTKETAADALIFEDEKFISEAYQKKGYEPTNYSLTVDEEDVTNFGTMQIKDKETTFWKGKVSGDKISGSIHVQNPSGNNVTRYYKGTLSEGTLVRKSKAKPVKLPPPPPVVKKEPVQSVAEDVK